MLAFPLLKFDDVVSFISCESYGRKNFVVSRHTEGKSFVLPSIRIGILKRQ